MKKRKWNESFRSSSTEIDSIGDDEYDQAQREYNALAPEYNQLIDYFNSISDKFQPMQQDFNEEQVRFISRILQIKIQFPFSEQWKSNENRWRIFETRKSRRTFIETSTNRWITR